MRIGTLTHCECFNDRDKKCILPIPLSSDNDSDELTCGLTKNGFYSVKTAYLLGKGCNLDDSHQAWVDISSVEASPKVRHFLWQLCSKSLPTRALLHYRHLIGNDAFPWGCDARETDIHALFGCPRLADYGATAMMRLCVLALPMNPCVTER